MTHTYVKSALLGALFTSTVLTATTAEAGGMFFAKENLRPYAGLEYQYTKAQLDTVGGLDADDFFEDSYQSLAPYVGLKVGKYFGLEAGYTHSLSEEKNFTGTISGIAVSSDLETKLKGWTVDALGFLPLGPSQKAELIGSVGVGFYTLDVSGTVSAPGLLVPTSFSDSQDDTALRLGLGAQYNVTDNVSVRGMVRYVNTDIDFVDHAMTYSLGVSYTF